MVDIHSRRVHDKAQDVYESMYNNYEDFRNWHNLFPYNSNWWFQHILNGVWVNWYNPTATIEMLTMVLYNVCENIAEEEGLLY